MDRVARADDQRQRRHDAREDVDPRPAQAQYPHRPHRTDKRGHTGDDGRGEAAGHGRGEDDGEDESEAVEDEHVPTEGAGGFGAEGREPGELDVEPIPAGGEYRGLDASEDRLGGGRRIPPGGQAHKQERRAGIGGEEVPGDEGMMDGALQRRGARLAVERSGGAGDDREERPGRALAADIEHRPHLLDPIDLPHRGGKRPESVERERIEERALPGLGPDDAIAVGGAKAGGDLVDRDEFRVAVPQERPQVVIHPQP